MGNNRDVISLTEAVEVLKGRGMAISRDWITRKAAAGAIEGAQKVGNMWLIPRSWAESYVKSTKGRKPKEKTNHE